MDSQKTKISFFEIYEAYRKFKTHVYYNGTSLSVRRKLADFERNNFGNLIDIDDFQYNFIKKFKKVFERIANLINDDNYDTEWIKKWNIQLKPYVTIKSLAESEYTKDNLISNELSNEPIKIDSCNILIDAPIEIHILSVLFVMVLGKRFQPLISSHNYAYRLSIHNESELFQSSNEEEFNNNGVQSNMMLFEPYFIGYQQWRDNGIAQANKALDNDDNVVILSLDVKRYFYSVSINVLELMKKAATFIPTTDDGQKLSLLEKRLCEILDTIHLHYSLLLESSNLEQSNRRKIEHTSLPVGLASSGFLGNLYLRPFDMYICDIVSPSYYGRYVDDILMVFSGKGLKISKSKDGSYVDQFITDHLINQQNNQRNNNSRYGNLLREEDSDDCSEHKKIVYKIIIDGTELNIQKDKIIMEYFKSKESRAAINKFTKQLEKNRSEFRFLPFEEIVDTEFDDEAFRLETEESINKLRNIKGISENKYGASKFLAQKIFLSILPFDQNE